MSPDPKEDRQGGLQLSTLLISSLSAVAAAVVVPMFWERGSLIATAVTPIIVALVTEALNRPTKVITQTVPRVTRRTGTGAAVRAEQPTGVGARGEGPERVPRWGDEDDPFGLRAPERRRRGFPWKLGIATGLVAAVIGAGVVTASELAIFGHSVGGGEGRSTSVFGGSRDVEETPTPTATPTATEQATETPTPEATETPTPTVTETATPTPSASPTATPPLQATPTPQVAPTTTPTIAPTP
ncbi:hypothetical protein DVA67_031465 [Solirubrobacter sp. CPCC 204708]|uniref:Uncharacterized protein n=1 Tax=Solirubrobacter deserti TaxID=2282478 RepID=A0ABT4RR71_9ACTN|nr:hypothetical protein [Solirubrobacter deserti]MBE2320524.1 hypothetical protein [Solirubrobacter deserti]MDA0140770.1 hypothetical protein [Solirubrobacter deserti]